jgi:thiol peroxidase
VAILVGGCGEPSWKAAAAKASDTTGPGTPATLWGKPLSLEGATLRVGDAAPDVTLADRTGREVKLSSLRGKVVLLSVVPDLDTPVCTSQTHKFSKLAPGMGPDVAVVTVSTNSPFDQERWCRENEISNLRMLSDRQRMGFGSAYGVKIAGKSTLARSVFVVDRQGVIRHIETVGEMTREPDYAAAMEAVRKLLRE